MELAERVQCIGEGKEGRKRDLPQPLEPLQGAEGDAGTCSEVSLSEAYRNASVPGGEPNGITKVRCCVERGDHSSVRVRDRMLAIICIFCGI